MNSGSSYKALIVIPVYNHSVPVAALVEKIQAQGNECLLVNDGSQDSCMQALNTLAKRFPEIVRTLHLPQNMGKGAAVMAGMKQAHEEGYTHVLQIDADGQHNAADIPSFLQESRKFPAAIVCGSPIYDASVPKSRLYGRYLTHVWVWINTLSLDIRDSMCGFRVYPLQSVMSVVDSQQIGRRMDFDTEIIVRMHWNGVKVINRLTRVIYPEGGTSHFDVLHDNIRISKMHAKLFFGMLLRWPKILLNRWRPV